MTDRIATLSLDPVVVSPSTIELATHDVPACDALAEPDGLNSSSVSPLLRKRRRGQRDVPSMLRAERHDVRGTDRDQNEGERPDIPKVDLKRIERSREARVESPHLRLPTSALRHTPAKADSKDNANRNVGEAANGLLREFLLGPENRLIAQGIGIDRDILGHELLSTEEATNPVDEEPQLKPTADLSDLRFDSIPLTVYGTTGYGKTQLLRGIRATWIRQKGVDETIFITASDFARRYTDAQKLDEIPHLQQRYHRASLVLIDDLDQLKRKPGAQETLAKIIDHRQRHNRPTVLAIQIAPQFARLNERLVSRMSSGLVVPLELPSRKTRAVILQRLCERVGLKLSVAATRLLNEQEGTTVPEFAGLISRLFAALAEVNLPAPGSRTSPNRSYLLELQQGAQGHPDQITMSGPLGEPQSWDRAAVESTVVSIEQVRSVLAGRPSQPTIEPRKIIRDVANYFGLTAKQVTGKSRRKMEVQARSIAMFLIREVSDLSFQKIGESFGKRDHSTVMHACEKVSEKLVADPELRTSVNEIRRKLSA